MIHRMFFSKSHELGLTTATKKLLEAIPAEAPQPRFYSSICAPVAQEGVRNDGKTIEKV